MLHTWSHFKGCLLLIHKAKRNKSWKKKSREDFFIFFLFVNYSVLEMAIERRPMVVPLGQTALTTAMSWKKKPSQLLESWDPRGPYITFFIHHALSKNCDQSRDVQDRGRELIKAQEVICSILRIHSLTDWGHLGQFVLGVNKSTNDPYDQLHSPTHFISQLKRYT